MNGKVVTVRISDELHAKLEKVAEDISRSKSWLIVESLKRHLDDLADVETALERLRNPDTKWISHDEVINK